VRTNKILFYIQIIYILITEAFYVKEGQILHKMHQYVILNGFETISKLCLRVLFTPTHALSILMRSIPLCSMINIGY
jgi:hypothetical protein